MSAVHPRKIPELAGGAYDAYRIFAIHSCDTETRYRRDESWETGVFTLDEWTDEAADALEAEFARIEKVPYEMETKCADRELLEELRPWLVEFGKLGTRGKKAIALARMFRNGCGSEEFLRLYRDNVMSEEDIAAYNARKSGTMKLQPFYEALMKDLYESFVSCCGGMSPGTAEQ